MKRKLLLITDGFPFGESERSFLNTEFQYLCREFQVHILAHSQEPLLYPLPDDVMVERYEYGPILHPCRIADLYSFLQLLISPFHPFVYRELRSALYRCTPKIALSRVKSILRYSVQAWQMERQLRRIIKEEGTHLIYTYWCTEATLAAIRLKSQYPNLKVITRFHGYDLYRERQADGWQPFRQMLSQKCDRLIFVAEAGKRYYIDHWGQQWTNKSSLSYLGCRDMGMVHPAGNTFTLVSCSNLIPLKRVELIIEALALLPESIRVDWHHFGDGTERTFLQKHAEEMLPPHIHWKFWGAVPNDQLSTHYHAIEPNLFITTSSIEGLPVSIQEAASAGIPTVGTAVGGIPELVRDGETGFLLSKDPSAEEIAAAIQHFYELPFARRVAMGVAARALWEDRFNAEKNAEQFIGLLEQILSN